MFSFPHEALVQGDDAVVDPLTTLRCRRQGHVGLEPSLPDRLVLSENFGEIAALQHKLSHHEPMPMIERSDPNA